MGASEVFKALGPRKSCIDLGAGHQFFDDALLSAYPDFSLIAVDIGYDPEGLKRLPPRKNADRFRRVVFLLACVLLAVTYVTGIVRFVEYKSDTGSHQLYMYYFYHSAPLMAFCAVCGLLRR